LGHGGFVRNRTGFVNGYSAVNVQLNVSAAV
jgi:hypothetical protein